MSDKKVSNKNQSGNGMNLCNRCRHGFFSMWGSYSTYSRYAGCPYSSHSHYPRKECVFYDKGNVPFCPQHKCDMKCHGTYGEITIYRCHGYRYSNIDKTKCICSREIWVHKNGLKRQVERGLNIKSRTAKGLLEYAFNIIESTKNENWE